MLVYHLRMIFEAIIEVVYIDVYLSQLLCHANLVFLHFVKVGPQPLQLISHIALGGVQHLKCYLEVGGRGFNGFIMPRRDMRGNTTSVTHFGEKLKV